MPQDTNQLPVSKLCYLDAEKVTLPTGVLADLSVVTSDGTPVGSIAGVVLEPSARRVRYYDVRSSGLLRQRRQFIEASELAQVDSDRNVLRLLSSDVRSAADPRLADLHEYSDDDLLRAVFSPRAA